MIFFEASVGVSILKDNVEIDTIKKISNKIDFKYNDQIIIDFTEIGNKNYHDGIKFTFFAKDVRGEVASGGRYKIKKNSTEESAVGFTSSDC